jgi:RNA polymerase sigma factor (sigma-70 family)
MYLRTGSRSARSRVSDSCETPTRFVDREAEAARWVGALFREHARMVLAICRTHLCDPDDAEDAAQQTFLSAYRALLGGTRPGNAAGWLATIARNECRTRIARRLSTPSTVPLLEDLSDALAGDVQAQAERQAEVEELTSALGELPERQREAVVLRDVYGLSYDEVAVAMSVSAPAVESLLSRGRRSLARRVGQACAAPSVLVVPGSLSDDLPQVIPGFPAAESTGVLAGGGAAGVLVKLMSAPLLGKAAVAAAVATLAVSADVGINHLRNSEPAGRAIRAAAPANQPKISPRVSLEALGVDRLVLDRRLSPRVGVGPSGGDSRGSGSSRSSVAHRGSTSSARDPTEPGPASTSSDSDASSDAPEATSSGSGSSSSGSESVSSEPDSTSSGPGSGESESGSGSTDSEPVPANSRSGLTSAGTLDSEPEPSETGSDSTSSSEESETSGSDAGDSGSASGTADDSGSEDSASESSGSSSDD